MPKKEVEGFLMSVLLEKGQESLMSVETRLDILKKYDEDLNHSEKIGLMDILSISESFEDFVERLQKSPLITQKPVRQFDIELTTNS